MAFSSATFGSHHDRTSPACHAPIDTRLFQIAPHKQLHDVLRSSTPYVSQIGVPYSGTVGVLDDLVTGKVIHVSMGRSPFLRDCSQKRLGISIGHYPSIVENVVIKGTGETVITM